MKGTALIFAAFFQQLPLTEKPAQTVELGRVMSIIRRVLAPVANLLAKLYKLDTTEVDHFEILDDNHKLIFSGSPPSGQIFTAVSFSGIGIDPEHAQLADLGVHRRSTGESTGPNTSDEYYFHVTPTGLVRFEPALDYGGASRVEPGNPDAWPPTGVTEGCQFDASTSTSP